MKNVGNILRVIYNLFKSQNSQELQFHQQVLNISICCEFGNITSFFYTSHCSTNCGYLHLLQNSRLYTSFKWGLFDWWAMGFVKRCVCVVLGVGSIGIGPRRKQVDSCGRDWRQMSTWVQSLMKKPRQGNIILLLNSQKKNYQPFISLVLHLACFLFPLISKTESL